MKRALSLLCLSTLLLSTVAQTHIALAQTETSASSTQVVEDANAVETTSLPSSSLSNETVTDTLVDEETDASSSADAEQTDEVSTEPTLADSDASTTTSSTTSESSETLTVSDPATVASSTAFDEDQTSSSSSETQTSSTVELPSSSTSTQASSTTQASSSSSVAQSSSTTDLSSSSSVTKPSSKIKTSSTSTTTKSSSKTKASSSSSTSSSATEVRTESQVATKEAFRKIGGSVDTLVLPNGGLLFKVKLDTLIVENYSSKQRIKITNRSTGQVVLDQRLDLNEVDRSALKTTQNLGMADAHNVATEYLSPNNFSSDPYGNYNITIYGDARASGRYDAPIVGSINFGKNISFNDRAFRTKGFRRINGGIDTIVQADGSLIVKTRLDTLVSSNWYGITRLRVTNKETGNVVYDGSFRTNEIDNKALKNNLHKGLHNFSNVASDVLGAYEFKDNPYGTYTVTVYGYTHRTNHYNSPISGAFVINKDVSFQNRSHKAASIGRVGGKVDLVVQPNGTILYSVKTDTRIVNNSAARQRIRFINKKTGQVIDDRSLTFNDIDQSVLKNNLHKGQSGVGNVATGELYNYNYRKDPNATYVVKVYGDTRKGTSYDSPVEGALVISREFKTGNGGARPVAKGQKEVYRLYHSGLQVHLYTTDKNERNTLTKRGWKYEGVSWKTETKKGTPVYRLYHPGLRYHFYTKDANEYHTLGRNGWNKEGVAYRNYGSVPIYRLYHSGLRKHLYTRDVNERNTLRKRGWKYEGVAWYSQP